MGADEFIWHRQRALRAARKGRLLFVLGAGISRPFGLPDWDGLIDRLLSSSAALRPGRNLDDRPTSLTGVLAGLTSDPLFQGAVARAAHPRRRWLAALHQALWDGHRAGRRLSGGAEEAALTAVADILLAQARRHPGKHIPVITFNYDDLLQQILADRLPSMPRPVRVQQIRGESEYRSHGRRPGPGIVIYHLHGFMPEVSPARELREVIFDGRSYADILADPAEHWTWDCLTRALGDSPTAQGRLGLLLGLSLLDPSLRLWLEVRARARSRPCDLFVSGPLPRLNPSLEGPDLLRATEIQSRLVTLVNRVLMELRLVPFRMRTWENLAPSLRRLESEISRSGPPALSS
ncbi:MAG: hypothetical protein GY719_20225 [bacterium]|nr:hypothetical protein [bacterium]